MPVHEQLTYLATMVIGEDGKVNTEIINKLRSEIKIKDARHSSRQHILKKL